MSGTRNKGIIAYGTQEDREKLAVLSHLMNLSGSECVIQMIRDKYRSVAGDADPKSIINQRPD